MSSPDKKSIGARLRAAREAPPYWSRKTLAQRLRAAAAPADRAALPGVESLTHMIKEWEAGKYVPRPDYRALYARATGKGETELFGDYPPAHGALWRPNGINGSITPDDEERLALATHRPTRLDTAALDALSTVLAGQRRLEDTIGSAPLIAPVRAQLAVIESLVNGARGTLRQRVVDVASQWAQFAAWLHASCRQLDEADRLYDRAIVWATEADVPDMAATAWNMKGHTAWVRRAVGPMIGLSQAALRDRRATPGVRALAAQQEARGHAITGDLDAMDRQLDLAQTLTLEAAAAPDEEPPWIYFFDASMFALQRARAYLYVPERAEAAAELLEAGLAGMPTEMRRSEWIAHYLADLARVYRDFHEDGEADRIINEVDQIAQATGSSILAREVAALR
ncbi:hypothetical protein BZB76_0722 [Actinomadura pelletieri DSM 43383]|uniref:HTH cro/C1-type domain-containing protein n=1 Tax=Actinomadura pelletieri DSM 43383 TaxID=1120940 RepID=A0A495QYR3_9ACTN|nr:XRE family transcriptional regulator [Actinomadura pelletieri]RKS79270.1 hypothetical protein BZB76_0722 [Actinomadura pelletieri DSM 43383]